LIILDTNVLSEMMRPVPNLQVVRWLEREPLVSLATTSISIAEICYGILRLPDGRRKVGLQDRFEEFGQGFMPEPTPTPYSMLPTLKKKDEAEAAVEMAELVLAFVVQLLPNDVSTLE